MLGVFYVIEQEFSNGLENGFHLNKFDNLEDAFRFFDKRKLEVETLWENVPHSRKGNDKSFSIVKDDFGGDAYTWTVVSEGRLTKAIMDAVYNDGKPGVIEYIGNDVRVIDTIELSLPYEALPWTNMYSDKIESVDDGEMPEYKPIKVILRPSDMDDPMDDDKMFDVCMYMKTDDDLLTYNESLEIIGDLVLANIFVHL